MKKRSSLIIISLLIILVAFSLYVYKSKGKASTVDADARNFKFKDTALITKIFIANKEGSKSTLERTAKGWVVNGKYICRRDALLNLMEAIKNIEVKMPVPKKAKEGVLKAMAATAVKIEIYTGDDLVKQYYVGHETPDSEGSYILLTDPETGENYPEPFVGFIPGFKGFLAPRFIAPEGEWRDRTILSLTPPQIKQIKLQNNENPDSSFTINLISTTSFKLRDAAGKDMNFDQNKMKQYLAYFMNASYEGLFTGKDKKLEDSLAKVKPFAVLSISTNDFKTSDYKFYYKKPTALIPEHGVAYTYDPDRLYLKFDNDKEWALIQYFVFGKILVTPYYFLPSDVKK